MSGNTILMYSLKKNFLFKFFYLRFYFTRCILLSSRREQGVWNMPATEYGKYLKKLRIDKDKTLAAMAKDMGIAPSYLSAIESGERVIPVDFTEKISEKYSLDDMAKDELRELELKTPRNALQLDFKKSGSTEEQKNLAILFAQKYAGLSTEQIEKIRAVLEEK